MQHTLSVIKKNEEKEEKSKCFGIKSLMDKKLEEVTNLKAQLEGKLKDKGKDIVRDALKETPEGKLLVLIEAGEKEYNRLKGLFEECMTDIDFNKRTKFILHGGFNPEQRDENNTDFYVEVLKNAPENSKILLVPFAKDVERIPSSIAKVTSEFNKNKWQKNIVIEIANEKDLIQQVKSANIIYFFGGISSKLLEVLKKYPDLKTYLKGKTIVGESAGANVWGNFFYSPQADSVFEGLGVLPLKIIPHYKKEYEGKLGKDRAELEEVLLPEYTYKVFYQ